MSDEPRDGKSDGAATPTGPASDPRSPAVPGTDPADVSDIDPADSESAATDTDSTESVSAESTFVDGRTDGSRTDVSAPWERPRRWERSGLDAGRVDALLARLGDTPTDTPADDSTGEPSTRRSRRKNNDGEAVPASALIAALGTSAGVTEKPDAPADSTSATDSATAAGDPALTDRSSAVSGAAGSAGEAETGPTPDRGTAEEAGAAKSAGEADSDAPAADRSADEPGDPADDLHTDPLLRSSDNAADQAEATSIRAALERHASSANGNAAAATAAAAGVAGKKPLGRKTTAGPVATAGTGAAGPTLVHGAERRRQRGWLYAGRTVAALVAVITLLAVGVEWKIKDRAEVGLVKNAIVGPLPTNDPSISTARTTPMIVTNSQGVKTTEQPKPKAVYQPENILLLGSDTRAGSNAALGGSDDSTAGVANSDTLMVAHISGDREHVTVLSIPRDTIITTPACRGWSLETGKITEATATVHGGTYSHINTLYAVGGPQCTAAGVQSLTGLGITRIIGIDFDGFKAMVDALGGITVNICKPIQDAVLGTVVAKGGVQVIKGLQAISLVRARDVIGDTESDLARIRRQQVVLSAILRQVTQAGTLLNPGKLDGFLQAFVNNTFTLNVKLEDLLTLAGSLGSLDPAHVTFYTLPTVPSTRFDGALDVDKSKAAVVFDHLINDLPLPGEATPTSKPKPTPATTTAPTTPSLKLTVDPSKVDLELYNLSGRDNVAGMAQKELNAAGFSIDDNQLFTSARVQTATSVQFDPTNRAAALTVAAAVPGSTLVAIPGLGTTLHLQLGSSFAGLIKTVAVGQQAPASLATAISTGPSVTPPKTSLTLASTALSSVNAGAGTCA